MDIKPADDLSPAEFMNGVLCDRGFEQIPGKSAMDHFDNVILGSERPRGIDSEISHWLKVAQDVLERALSNYDAARQLKGCPERQHAEFEEGHPLSDEAFDHWRANWQQERFQAAQETLRKGLRHLRTAYFLIQSSGGEARARLNHIAVMLDDIRRYARGEKGDGADAHPIAESMEPAAI